MKNSTSPEVIKQELVLIEDEFIRMFNEIESLLRTFGFPPHSSNMPLSISEQWGNSSLVYYDIVKYRRFVNDVERSHTAQVDLSKVYTTERLDAQRRKRINNLLVQLAEVVSFHYPKDWDSRSKPIGTFDRGELVNRFAHLRECQRRWDRLALQYHDLQRDSPFQQASHQDLSALSVTRAIMSRRSREAVEQRYLKSETTDDQVTTTVIHSEHISTPDCHRPSEEPEESASGVQSDDVDHIDDPSLNIAPLQIPDPWKFYIEHDKGKWNWKLKQAKLARVLALLRSENIFGDISANGIGDYAAMFLSIEGKEINPSSLGSEVRKYKGYETGLDVTELEKKVVRWVLKM